MLKYKGHIFAGDGAACACCTIADKQGSSDPTGTKSLRSKMRATLALRWRKLRVLAKQIIVDNDLLQLNNEGLLAVPVPGINQGGMKTQAFQRWFDYALNQVVLGGDGSVMRPMLNQAYMDGMSFGQKQTKSTAMLGSFGHTQDTIFSLAVVELQGIMEAVSQQSVRAVANGLLMRRKPNEIVREIQNRIDVIGVTRTNAMVDQLIVAAFNQAALDVYQAAGIQAVGLVAELLPPKKIGDAAISDARRRRGPGSRISRKASSPGPSTRTIQRIRRVERNIERLGRVEVRTAGDNDVCAICEDIADNGPYKIDTARSLIPAHPHCRCAFIPADDEDE